MTRMGYRLRLSQLHGIVLAMVVVKQTKYGVIAYAGVLIQRRLYSDKAAFPLILEVCMTKISSCFPCPFMDDENLQARVGWVLTGLVVLLRKKL